MSEQHSTANTHSNTESGEHSRPQHRYQTTNTQKRQLTVKTQVAVHKDYVGAVIGKGGSTINKIKDDTKTRISYLEDDFSKGHQSPVFLITGPPQGVQRAEKWVRNILQSTWEAEQGEKPEASGEGDSTESSE
tara:strand:- start:249 stop:647 length:399 start_codon:yes stop_codon:yes gene_type:complete